MYLSSIVSNPANTQLEMHPDPSASQVGLFPKERFPNRPMQQGAAGVYLEFGQGVRVTTHTRAQSQPQKCSYHATRTPPGCAVLATPHEAVCVKVCLRQRCFSTKNQAPHFEHNRRDEPGTGLCARPPPRMSAPRSANLQFDEDEPRYRSMSDMHAVHTDMRSQLRISSARPPSGRALLLNAARP